MQINNAVAIAQDRQDRSLLQSLELEREATLIELAQAERRYEETKSPSIIDAVSPGSPPAYDAFVPDVDEDDTGLHIRVYYQGPGALIKEASFDEATNWAPRTDDTVGLGKYNTDIAAISWETEYHGQEVSISHL